MIKNKHLYYFVPPDEENVSQAHAIKERGWEQLSKLGTMLDISLRIVSSPKDVFLIIDCAISIFHIEMRHCWGISSYMLFR
jgi:hypothetical protein